MKSTVEEIRSRFDNEVERFSNSESGQISTVDSALALGLIEECIYRMNPDAKFVCDIGCGAGNFTLRVLKRMPSLNCTLIDLSKPMLNKAKERILKINGIVGETIQGDIRDIVLKENTYDIIIAAAVLHHLRTKAEWESVLRNIYSGLKANGTFWMWDLVKYDNNKVNEIQKERYSEYLTNLKGREYQKDVFAYIEKEDTPESSSFIVSAMLQTGFKEVEIVHKNINFCALYGKK